MLTTKSSHAQYSKWGNHTQRHGSGRGDSHDDGEGRTHESHKHRAATLTARGDHTQGPDSSESDSQDDEEGRTLVSQVEALKRTPGDFA